MVETLKDRKASVCIVNEHLKRHCKFVYERQKEEGACRGPPHCSQMVSIYPFAHSADTKKKKKKTFSSAQSLKLQTGESWSEKTEMGEAPRGIELFDIPVKCTGIKPGVKPPLLFRLEATKQRAIWQTVR